MYLLPDAVRGQMPVSGRRNPWSVLIDWTSASPGLGAGEGEGVWPEVARLLMSLLVILSAVTAWCVCVSRASYLLSPRCICCLVRCSTVCFACTREARMDTVEVPPYLAGR